MSHNIPHTQASKERIRQGAKRWRLDKQECKGITPGMKKLIVEEYIIQYMGTQRIEEGTRWIDCKGDLRTDVSMKDKTIQDLWTRLETMEGIDKRKHLQ